ncbi:DNA methyltransferase [Novimethylophilus kurashikiensis]|uniref:DNA methyltransferase n=1 Tax=Novimethylophilus kurashikiensis TaxID=1825523 RepID=A0A2R5F942_9PROT|nr:hypothetical protein [Novimethylophilus kurashikiensis]GBG14339.1 DNA methyltransferase [Novimethylophilus kurashikiensis]
MQFVFLFLVCAAVIWVLHAPVMQLSRARMSDAVKQPTPEVGSKPGKWVEWMGAAAGMTGSALLACHNAYSGYGFVAYLLSNGCWLWFGLKTRTWGMVAMQMGFIMTSIIGSYNWLS